MEYIGSELDLFQNAKNWKAYWSRHIAKFVSGDVLEVGAGIGGNIPYLHPNASSYTAIEPDNNLTKQIQANVQELETQSIRVLAGTLADVPETELYDTIVYIDVLEHIDNDQIEFERAIAHLRPGGNLIVLCPAHQFLFSEFDKAVGHFRRHSKTSFRELSASVENTSIVQISYLDSVGLFASMANRFLLKSGMPTRRQIGLWDGFMVPLSKICDVVTFRSIGKTVIGVWRKA